MLSVLQSRGGKRPEMRPTTTTLAAHRIRPRGRPRRGELRGTREMGGVRADEARGIAGTLQQARHRHALVAQHAAVIAEVPDVVPTHERAAAWRAHGVARVRICKAHAIRLPGRPIMTDMLQKCAHFVWAIIFQECRPRARRTNAALRRVSADLFYIRSEKADHHVSPENRK